MTCDASGEIAPGYWDDVSDRYAERALGIIETYAPGLRALNFWLCGFSPADRARTQTGWRRPDLRSHHLSRYLLLFRSARGYVRGAAGRRPAPTGRRHGRVLALRAAWPAGLGNWPGDDRGFRNRYLAEAGRLGRSNETQSIRLAIRPFMFGFSHAVEQNGGRRHHLAGQVGGTAGANSWGPGDLRAQARCALANLKDGAGRSGRNAADVAPGAYLRGQPLARQAATCHRDHGLLWMGCAARRTHGLRAVVAMPEFLIEIGHYRRALTGRRSITMMNQQAGELT